MSDLADAVDGEVIVPVKILLVDDDPVNQALASYQLECLGYTTEIASGGQMALDKLDRSAFDIILMDCQMPLMDGYRTSQLIRRREGGQRHSIIIAMTANSMESD